MAFLSYTVGTQQSYETVFSQPSQPSIDAFIGSLSTGAFSDAIVASTLHEFFDHKVDAIRDATCADPPTFTSVPYDCDLSTFGTVTADDVITATRRLSDKQCTTDILPTWLFKLCAAELKQRSAG